MKASKIDRYFVDVVTWHAGRALNIKVEDVYYYCVWTYYWLIDYNTHTHDRPLESITRNLRGLVSAYESL